MCAPLSSVFLDAGPPDAGTDAGLIVDAGSDGGAQLAFCPNDAVSRAEMARVVLRMAYGPEYTPPAATGRCSDAMGHPLEAWMEDATAQRYIRACDVDTTRCCPDIAISRGAAATFLLRGSDGPAYAPPVRGASRFADVPATHPRVDWVEELAVRGITEGCRVDETGMYFCPDEPLVRAAMAVLVHRLEYMLNEPALPSSGAFCDVDGNRLEPYIDALYVDGFVEACAGSCE
jgi:hypothetical protein